MSAPDLFRTSITDYVPAATGCQAEGVAL